MEMLKGISLDLKEENLNRLKEIFPEVFEEGKIDFEELRLLLGDNVEEKEERYEFNWNGKRDAIRIAQTPSTGTLRPDKDSSKNWDDTENLYIEGDNLEVLKLLQKSYFGKVKMIYIDPPYNTGKDFIYKDNFRDNIANYKEITSQTTKANPETNGRYHTDWLNMMYPRLKLARNLLRDDGVIFISIDENEQLNLKILCNYIFGEENFAGEIVWKNSSKNDQAYISIQHEYIICYTKNKNCNKGDWKEKKEGLDEIFKAFEKMKKELNSDWDEIHKRAILWYKQFSEANPIFSSKHYNWMDANGVYFPADISGPNYGQYRYDVIHPVTGKICKQPASGWRFPKETMLERISNGLVHFGKDETTIPNNKVYLKDTQFQSLTSIKYKDGRVASKELEKLMDGKVFTNPKDLNLLNLLFDAIGVDDNDLVLDFFSGSATTAHTVMQMNVNMTGNVKYIMIQLPEQTDEKSEAYKAGYKNICEIGKERIRRAGDKIVSENKDKEGIENLDIGFKVFKLDSSNLKSWDSSMENLEQNLLSMETNLKKDRSNEDLLYEILLKSGIKLTAKIEEIKVGYNTLYNIGCGALLVCLDDKITQDVIDEIPKHKSPYMETKVIFKEAGFMSDAAKINAIQNLKQFQIEDVRSV